jgi:hypothetical protein
MTSIPNTASGEQLNTRRARAYLLPFPRARILLVIPVAVAFRAHVGSFMGGMAFVAIFKRHEVRLFDTLRA